MSGKVVHVKSGLHGLVRTDPVYVLRPVAVPAHRLHDRGVAFALQPVVEHLPFAPVQFLAVVIDVIERQEPHVVDAATNATRPVVLKSLFAQSDVAPTILLSHLVRVFAAPPGKVLALLALLFLGFLGLSVVRAIPFQTGLAIDLAFLWPVLTAVRAESLGYQLLAPWFVVSIVISHTYHYTVRMCT
jgi:hypothetical protein